MRVIHGTVGHYDSVKEQIHCSRAVSMGSAATQMHSCFADKSMFSRGLVSTKILFTFLVGMQSMSVSSFKGKTSSSVWFLVLALGKICILIWVSCRGSGVKFLHIESYRAKNDKWHSFPLTRPTTYINTHLVD